MKLEELRPGARVGGVHPGAAVEVIGVERCGPDAVNLVFRDHDGAIGERILYREDEGGLRPADPRPWSFEGDGELFKLTSEAQRIALAHLFDPLLAVQTSDLEPLPHQITAVYEEMLPRQPLRFLLADDPGAGKTIMAGLLIKELLARSDAARCLIVCPGNLVEQWQDELGRRFGLEFDILTREKSATAASGNWFRETPRGIARMDMLARNEDLRKQLRAPDCDWELVVVDEAHKMSARFAGGEPQYTKRYRAGRLLSRRTRHLLLLTATPHRGIEDDYQLFLALLDADRFEGRGGRGRPARSSDLMRRVVKENLVRFDGRPLFPERRAHTVPYRLSRAETELYDAVTDYVSREFQRAEAVEKGRRRTVGFALTVLQRRLASSPQAICSSLRRRKTRLEQKREEMRSGREAGASPWPDEDFFEDLDDLPEDEIADREAEVLDRATAARTIGELTAEIETLTRLEAAATELLRRGDDRKWVELQDILTEIFGTGAPQRQKLVLFTEHRDTLRYLVERTGAFVGRPEAIETIHGGMARDARRLAQARFLDDPAVRMLLATDAAGEGINLQRAHLMVNYDLPWNPNRIEQRFGRIHRIGQTEVCHLWNLVAVETREGDVYRTLLEKLEQARKALGGQVFDVLGNLEFEGRPLRDLLVEAVRYGSRPEVRARLESAVEGATDPGRLRELIERRALAPETMDGVRVARVREQMERAEAARLQPHFVAAFFRPALARLGGTIRQRETERYEITRVPAEVREAARDRRRPVVRRYERIAFDKERLPGEPRAEFVAPGHPLLDAVVQLTLERNAGVLRQGAVLVDDRDPGVEPRVIVALEHAVRSGVRSPSGALRAISQRMLHVEITEGEPPRQRAGAPYLDFRPLAADEPKAAEVLARPECRRVAAGFEEAARRHAISTIVPAHLAEVRDRTLEAVRKTRAAVRERLTIEIAHWDRRAEDLKRDERFGKPAARLNSGEARKRAENLRERMRRRFEQLDRESDITAAPPRIRAAMLVAPAGLVAAMTGKSPPTDRQPPDTGPIAARARRIVMVAERELGFEPTDREEEKLGYDIESRNPATGRLRFLEVKGRRRDATEITVTRNEILTALNKPDDYLLAIVRFDEAGGHELRYLSRPFGKPPDDGAASVNYKVAGLWAAAAPPATTRR